MAEIMPLKTFFDFRIQPLLTTLAYYVFSKWFPATLGKDELEASDRALEENNNDE